MPQVKDNNVCQIADRLQEMRDPRFLIVDADPVNRRHLGDIIANLGADADEPTDPEEVQELCGKRRYDCVLVDRDIPKEWQSALENGSSGEPSVPLVFLTGPEESAPPSAVAISAADGYLPRGAESAELLTQHVRRAISRLVSSPFASAKGEVRGLAAGSLVGGREHLENSKIMVRTRRITAPGPVGDIVSVCNKGNDRYAVLLGDYTGPIGMGKLGSLYLQSRIDMLQAESPNPARLLGDLNAELVRAGSAVDYMTAVAVVVDLRRKRLTYSVAGHQAPLHRRWRGIAWRSLPGDDIPVGVRCGERYREHSRPVASGDKILLISDGFLKMGGGEKGFRSCERALEWFDALPADAAPSEVLDGISEIAVSATGGRMASDEITATLIQI